MKEFSLDHKRVLTMQTAVRIRKLMFCEGFQGLLSNHAQHHGDPITTDGEKTATHSPIASRVVAFRS
jgi:hypothetical protein